MTIESPSIHFDGLFFVFICYFFSLRIVIQISSIQKRGIHENLLLIIALCLSVAYSFAQTEPHVPIDLDNDGRLNITRLEHLKWLSESPYADLARDYELDNDIDASDSKNWNDGKGFIPIGYNDNWNDIKPFTGLFHGQRHTISNLYIYNSNRYGSTFINILQGQVLYLNLENCDFGGSGYAAGISTRVDSTALIDNCTFSGRLSASRAAGGLALSNSGVIYQSDFIGDIVIEEDDVNSSVAGGIAADNNYRIIECSAQGSITSNKKGGIVETNTDSIYGCSVDIKFYGNGITGGLVGENQGAIIQSYALGDIYDITSYCGGLIGYQFSERPVSDCYTKINCTDENAKFGTIVGIMSDGSIRNSYHTGEVWNNQRTNLNFYISNAGFSGILFCYYNEDRLMNGLTTKHEWARNSNELKNENTFTTWGFYKTWAIDPAINDGYPYLQNNKCELSLTGIKESERTTHEITIYPKPALNKINLEGGENFISYSIYDTSGKFISKGSESTINIEHLNPGAYMIYMITAEGKVASKNFVKK